MRLLADQPELPGEPLLAQGLGCPATGLAGAHDHDVLTCHCGSVLNGAAAFTFERLLDLQLAATRRRPPAPCDLKAKSRHVASSRVRWRAPQSKRAARL